MATNKLKDADEALDRAIESIEFKQNYNPISILFVPMNPSLLFTLAILGGTILWGFV